MFYYSDCKNRKKRHKINRRANFLLRIYFVIAQKVELERLENLTVKKIIKEKINVDALPDSLKEKIKSLM